MTEAKTHETAAARSGPNSQGQNRTVGRAAVQSADPSATSKFVRPPGMNPPPTDPAGQANTGAAKAQVAEAVRAARATVSAAASRGPRRARLHLKRIDPWSVMKFAFAVSLVLFIVMVVATSVLYLALDTMGVFDSVNKTLTSLIGSAGSGSKGFNLQITAKGVIGVAALLGVVNMVLFTALSTLGAFIYNVCSDLVGGIEVTLSEKD
ncbi:DUF3566 domain-containing protein [Actinocatenispora rupis]|uniref:DUF3566 domain-containing protein n=1 Tax=Actinocatenispora rupis TaxID=519421 RepID=A0A8J3JE91_9ACTN|nr:hypothetical protein Aru02nite_41220 [Actinocatenispora rupis]